MVHYWSLSTVRPLVKAALAPPTVESRIAASLAKSAPHRAREEQIHIYTGDRALRRHRAVCSACRCPTAAFQARYSSVTKEQQWAVAAAAVTLSKRREHHAQHCDSPAADEVAARAIGVGTAPCDAANSGSLAGNQGAAACALPLTLRVMFHPHAHVIAAAQKHAGAACSVAPPAAAPLPPLHPLRERALQLWRMLASEAASFTAGEGG